MQDIIRDFSGGVVQTMPADKLPPNFVYRAYDTAFRSLPGGTTVITRRPGWSQKSDITAANNRNVLGLFQWQTESSGTISRRLVSICSDGLLYVDGANKTIPHSGAAFDSLQYWKFEIAGNIVYGVATGGTADRFKLYDAAAITVADIGVAAPAAPSLNVAGAGGMTGEYDIACTWYNSYTGHETSLGTTASSGAITSKEIVVTKPASPPTEATHWRIYIRKNVIGVDFWQVVSNTIATATYDVDLTDTQINNLTILAPDTQENNAPPTNLRDLCWHQSRMFYTDGSLVYYSQPGLPEAVDPENVELINKSDGQRIVALVSLNENTLAVFKEKAIYALVGDSPQSWELRTLVPAKGAISNKVAKGDGLFAFWSENGPCVWDGISDPVDISNDVFREILETTRTSLDVTDKYEVVFDRGDHRFLFHVDPYTAGPYTEATWFHVWPWSTYHKVWEASGWEMPYDLKTIAVGFDKGVGTYDANAWVVYLGCSDGRIKVMSPAYRSDETASDVSTSGLVYTVTSNAAGTNDLFFTVSDTLKRSTTAVYPKACVIDAATLKVWRLGHEGFTVVNTSGSTYRLRDTNGVMQNALPAAGSIIVFDAPVAEVWTHRTAQDHTKRDYKLAMADVAASEDLRYFVGFFRDQATTPARVWHADETSDLDEAYPELASRSQPAGYPAGVAEGPDSAATGTERFFSKRIARAGYQHLLKWVGYWPGCRWYLKSLGVDFRGRRDGW